MLKSLIQTNDIFKKIKKEDGNNKTGIFPSFLNKSKTGVDFKRNGFDNQGNKNSSNTKKSRQDYSIRLDKNKNNLQMKTSVNNFCLKNYHSPQSKLIKNYQKNITRQQKKLSINTQDSESNLNTVENNQKKLKRFNSFDFTNNIINQSTIQKNPEDSKIQNQATDKFKVKKSPTKRLSLQANPLILLQQIIKQSKPTLNQHFHIGPIIGSGVESTVSLAIHKFTGCVYAIKAILKKQIKNKQTQQGIFRQLKIHLFLDHPNIISLYHINSDNQYIYAIMEYATEGNLYDLLKKKISFTQQQTAKIIKDVVQGLKTIHENQVIHRDLKLENIVLNNGIAKIADFGCSVHSYRLRRTLIGSPLYFSPQQLNNVFYCKKIDIWSVGVMTYQMLYGFPPFEKQIISIFYESEGKIQLQVKFPASVSLSSESKDFLRRCLHKIPAQRLSPLQMLNHPFLNKI